MDKERLVSFLENNNSPSGLGGCHIDKTSYDVCEYDITVFDGIKPTTIIKTQNHFLKIHHGSFDEQDARTLVQYDAMEILEDPSWELRMFLAKVNQKKPKYYTNAAKDSLLDSIFCATSAQNQNDIFSSCWLKCSSLFLAEAIAQHNQHRPSPSHMLDHLRRLEKNKVNQALGLVTETLGIERATPNLLQRMTKSTVGFSDVIENNGHGQLIHQKAEHMIKNSLFSDCYFYLSYLNMKNFITIKQSLARRQDLIHILRIGFDTESEPLKIESQARQLEKTSKQILSMNI